MRRDRGSRLPRQLRAELEDRDLGRARLARRVRVVAPAGPPRPHLLAAVIAIPTLRLLALVVFALFGCLAAPAAAAGSGEFGVVAQDKLAPSEYGELADAGAATLRIGIVWSSIEPQPGSLDLEYLDSVVSNAADHGIRLLPFVYGAPDWVTGSTNRPPIYSAYERRLWADLLQTLVRRYGAGGELGEQEPN